MEYIFDLFLNWQTNETLYDFFEWNPSDDIEIIKVIPIVKVNSEDYLNIMKNRIKFSEEVLKDVYQKTQIQSNNSIFVSKYAFIVTEGNDAIAVECSEDGEVIKKSSMHLECVLEVISKNLKTYVGCVEVLENISQEKNNFNSRKERELIVYLKVQLDRMFLSKDREQLRFLYYDVFDFHEINDSDIYEKLKQALDSRWSKIHDQMYEMVQIMMTN